jgi:hypothetical protein
MLTDQKLYFRPHLFTRSRQIQVVDLCDIKGVYCQNLGFFDRFNISVTTISGHVYLIRVYAGLRWIAELRALDVCVVQEG